MFGRATIRLALAHILVVVVLVVVVYLLLVVAVAACESWLYTYCCRQWRIQDFEREQIHGIWGHAPSGYEGLEGNAAASKIRV